MLEVKDLDVSFGDKTALEDFNLEVEPGEIVSIVGESGSGKSTAIRSILGLLPANGKIRDGEILYEGREMLNFTPEEYGEIRGPEMSIIFQDSGAMMNPTQRIGKQFVEYIREHSELTKEEAKEKAIEMLERMNLPDPEQIMQRYPFQLSGGQRQRVGIAMAMTFEPKLLLADEPTSALDVTTQAQIIKEMTDLRDQYDTAIIMVTHNLGVASYMSDKIIVMKDGKIVEAGSAEEVIENPKSDYTKKLLAAVPKLQGGET